MTVGASTRQKEQKQKEQKRSLVIVTGLSGSGCSTCLSALEDWGYQTVDNLPMSLWPALFETLPKKQPVALSVDSRTQGFSSAAFLKSLAEFQSHQDLSVVTLFLEAETSVLARRFSETRRRHPLAPKGSVLEGIEAEEALFAMIRDKADLVADTSQWSIWELRDFLKTRLLREEDQAQSLHINLVSFSYKNGILGDADMILDVRFLSNPHYEEGLRALTGQDKAVGDFIVQDPNFAPFLKKLENLISFLIPLYREEGKSYFTLGIGCTGGKHRSVYVVEQLGAWLKKKENSVVVEHRNLPS